MKQRLHGIAVACMVCGAQARWVYLNFFYCDECIKKAGK
jgi:hypothetical protein